MVTNKTEVAWKIFNSDKKIKYPEYIVEAISDIGIEDSNSVLIKKDGKINE